MIELSKLRILATKVKAVSQDNERLSFFIEDIDSFSEGEILNGLQDINDDIGEHILDVFKELYFIQSSNK